MKIDRDQIQLQTISNLVAAGVLKKEEAEFYDKCLSAMTEKDALIALSESYNLRDNCPDPMDYYPIGKICEN